MKCLRIAQRGKPELFDRMLPAGVAAAVTDSQLFKRLPPVATATILATTAVISILGNAALFLPSLPFHIQPHPPPILIPLSLCSFSFPTLAVYRRAGAGTHLWQPRLLLESRHLLFR